MRSFSRGGAGSTEKESSLVEPGQDSPEIRKVAAGRGGSRQRAERRWLASRERVVNGHRRGCSWKEVQRLLLSSVDLAGRSYSGRGGGEGSSTVAGIFLWRLDENCNWNRARLLDGGGLRSRFDR
ncbi:basic helix-loop-helix (bHLH) DNA-bindingsuperfamily protein [Striga asiatica]|uniref:Basic helix-loop-helix (BHLH) DNA-bindingsuperfamily protein n=1 Tax=Striga asiatica TaxID=4170 RepID=A0A5A7Q388_STRAF|nr:basic helix-loop-helix (bHLH) DNA-bindingsuperfamily protein [Striga asiatica]